jgi:hypothetical protein
MHGMCVVRLELLYIVRCLSGTTNRILDWIYWPLSTPLITTVNYSAIANFHNLQFIWAHALSFPAHSVFTSSCLVTTPNNDYFSASVLKSSLNDGSLPTLQSCSNCPPYNISAEIIAEDTVSKSTSIVVCGLLPREPVCLRMLPRKGSNYYSVPALRLFIPNCLQAYCNFFFSKGCASSHLPPRGTVFMAITLQLLRP